MSPPKCWYMSHGHRWSGTIAHTFNWKGETYHVIETHMRELIVRPIGLVAMTEDAPIGFAGPDDDVDAEIADIMRGNQP